MPPKSKQKTKSKCKLCAKQEESGAIWGHELCPLHRTCGEGDHWDPYNCADCKKQKSKLTKMADDNARDNFFYQMYMMLRDTAKYKSETSQSEWTYHQGINTIFSNIPVPPISSFILSPPIEDNDNDGQSDGGASSHSQNSVISMVAQNRERLDKEMSDTVSKKIDDNFNSVDDYLHSNDHSDNNIPEFRVHKRDNIQQNIQSTRNAANKDNIPQDEVNSRNNYRQDSTRNTPNSESSFRRGDNIPPQQYNNSANSEIEFAPGAEHHSEEYDEYWDEDFVDDRYDDGQYDNHNSQSPDDYNNDHYNEDYYNTHSDSYGPQYHHPDNRRQYQSYTPYGSNSNFYPLNNRHTNSFQDPYAAQIAFNQRKNTHPRFQDENNYNFQSPPQPIRKQMDLDPISGQIWIMFDPTKHVKKDNNRMEVASSQGSFTCHVRYRVGHPDQFQTIYGPVSNSIAPIMEGRVAHSILLETFKRTSSHNQIDKSQCTMDSHIEPNHMVAKIMDLLKDNMPHIMTAAINRKEKDLFDSFPKLAFGSSSLVNFGLGWTLSGSSIYATFAKDKELDPLDFAIQLGMTTMKFSVHATLLKTERYQRQCLLQLFTQLHYFDLYAEKIDGAEDALKTRNDIQSTHMYAMAKPSIFILRYILKNWLSTKVRIRKAILPDRSKPAANALLSSNPFENKIFPDKDIRELRMSSQNKNILPALGLSFKGNWTNDNSEPPTKKQKTYHTDGYQTNEIPPFQRSKDFQRKPYNRGGWNQQRSRPGRGKSAYRGRGYASRQKSGNQANREFNTDNKEKSYNARDKSYNKDKSQNQEK